MKVLKRGFFLHPAHPNASEKTEYSPKKLNKKRDLELKLSANFTRLLQLST